MTKNKWEDIVFTDGGSELGERLYYLHVKTLCSQTGGVSWENACTTCMARHCVHRRGGGVSWENACIPTVNYYTFN